MGRYYREISPLLICVAIALCFCVFLDSFFIDDRNLYFVIGNITFYSILYFVVLYFFMTSYEKSLVIKIAAKIPFLRNII